MGGNGSFHEAFIFALLPGDLGPEEWAALARVREELARRLPGQEEYVDALVAGLASAEHVALISPPGTGKTYAVTLLRSLIDGARVYTALLNPYVDFDQLFGSIDIEALLKGKVRRRWSDIIRSDIVFLDEGFKAHPALLNSLLSLLNERVVYDPFTGESISAELKTAVIASNEVPEDESLRALWDRIMLRVYGRYLRAEQLPRALEAVTRAEPPRPVMNLAQLKKLNEITRNMVREGTREARAFTEALFGTPVPVTRVLEAMVVAPAAEVRKQLGVEEGSLETASLSDRTVLAKLPKIWATLVVLGLANAMPPPIAVLEALRRSICYTAASPEAHSEVCRTVGTVISHAFAGGRSLANDPRIADIPKLYRGLLNDLARLVAMANAGVPPEELAGEAKNIRRTAEALRKLLNSLEDTIRKQYPDLAAAWQKGPAAVRAYVLKTLKKALEHNTPLTAELAAAMMYAWLKRGKLQEKLDAIIEAMKKLENTATSARQEKAPA